MARKCFEVSALKLNLYYFTEKERKKVQEEFSKCMKKFISATSLKDFQEVEEDENGIAIEYFEFSKCISLSTVNQMLIRMDLPSTTIWEISYNSLDKCVVVDLSN